MQLGAGLRINFKQNQVMLTTKLALQFSGARLLHTMLRVSDLQRSLDFYIDTLGMRLLRRQDFPQGEYTPAFVGYADEASSSVLELTYNWDNRHYQHGDGYGHIAIGVTNLFQTVALLAKQDVPVIRAAGPLAGAPDEWLAFILDSDGYRIELIQREYLRSQADSEIIRGKSASLALLTICTGIFRRCSSLWKFLLRST